MEDKTMVTKAFLPPFEEYSRLIEELWNTRWITNMGKYHNQLESELKEYLKVNNISLMVNGHMALELAIQAMGFSRGSEVITTPFTFISTTHAIIRNGLKPVFCDIKLEDYTIDENLIESMITEKTVAIVPVHVYGNPCSVDEIQDIADKYNLKVIYDAAHAFGVSINGKGIGSFGDASVFSFHATKVFNTIEGGAVCYDNPLLNTKLYNLKNFGIRSEEVVSEIGANAKMNEFSAAMGLCNLKYISEEIQNRKRVIERYIANLQDVKGVTLIKNDKVKSNYAYFPVLFDQQRGMNRNEIYNELKKNNIYARKYFYPLTADQTCFKNKYRNINIPNARYVSDNILTLPVYGDLHMECIDNICDVIKSFTRR